MGRMWPQERQRESLGFAMGRRVANSTHEKRGHKKDKEKNLGFAMGRCVANSTHEKRGHKKDKEKSLRFAMGRCVANSTHEKHGHATVLATGTPKHPCWYAHISLYGK